MIAKDNGTYDWADEPRGKILEIIYPGQEA
jgi:hypothetical protein